MKSLQNMEELTWKKQQRTTGLTWPSYFSTMAPVVAATIGRVLKARIKWPMEMGILLLGA